MLCITLTAAALVAAGAAFAQEAPEGNRVEINGMQMYYEVSGGGDPHDKVLYRQRRVYALELQGHGRTTDIDRPITYPNVAAFMEAVGIEKADVSKLHAVCDDAGRPIIGGGGAGHAGADHRGRRPMAENFTLTPPGFVKYLLIIVAAALGLLCVMGHWYIAGGVASLGVLVVLNAVLTRRYLKRRAYELMQMPPGQAEEALRRMSMRERDAMTNIFDRITRAT
jgi:hypothetical protein